MDFDVLVIGGGPAGLAAALNMARFNRRVALFDTGQGRSSWHQTNHNYLGFPGGVPARKLRELAHQQLSEYPQADVIAHKVEAIERNNGTFTAQGQAGTWTGRVVMLCTGVVDHYPRFEGWDEYVGRSMFWCIACDGYNTQGKRVVVVGNSTGAAIEALQLTRFTPHLTVLTDSSEYAIESKYLERLERFGIPVVHDKLAKAVGADGHFEAIYTESGQCLQLDYLFTQHGATPQTKLAADLGVLISREGYIHIDGEQKTNVAGVYAAGDVTRLHSHQVATAVHEGTQAACAANYYLHPPELQY
jgi:thioredoxin reductase (NADPH)